jgi:hypothetical protein
MALVLIYSSKQGEKNTGIQELTKKKEQHESQYSDLTDNKTKLISSG